MDTRANTEKNVETLMDLLTSKDGTIRKNARQSLIVLGKKATSSLMEVLQGSKNANARWEAAKALGEIGDAKAIPALVSALQDRETDVVWLAAEALRNFGRDAWYDLFKALVKEGAESVILREAAHHVLWRQKDRDYHDLLGILIRTLESGKGSESTPVAASNLLDLMEVEQINKLNKEILD